MTAAPEYLLKDIFIPFSCVHHLPLVLRGLGMVVGGLWAVSVRPGLEDTDGSKPKFPYGRQD